MHLFIYFLNLYLATVNVLSPAYKICSIKTVKTSTIKKDQKIKVNKNNRDGALQAIKKMLSQIIQFSITSWKPIRKNEFNGGKGYSKSGVPPKKSRVTYPWLPGTRALLENGPTRQVLLSALKLHFALTYTNLYVCISSLPELWESL